MNRGPLLNCREPVNGAQILSVLFRSLLEGRFPKDKARLLAQLDALPASNRLDTNSPGRLPRALQMICFECYLQRIED
ncbi:MAG: hypothetical protein MUC65_05760 [Pontiellaceae bacterium]|nr:hypothetical protein [Pontiellaceae bacterium]